MAGSKQQLTARGLAALKPGEWANDVRPHGSGQLQARKLGGGAISFYYRYTGPGKRQDRLPLGTGLQLAEAREKAAELSRRYQAGDRDLRAVLEGERLARERKAAEAAAQQVDASLGTLLGAYVTALREAGKVSADEVESAIVRHVEKPWPTVWASPARALSMDDLLPLIARVARAGKLREAGKLRSYLRAAYAAAIRARQDPVAPDALRQLAISSNPVRDMAAIDGGNNARTRALSLGELRALWRYAAAAPAPDGPLLRFYLLTGGQRLMQLGRLTTDHLVDGGKTIHLKDLKGRRKKPRDHLVPLIDAACTALAEMRTSEPQGRYLFTTSRGIAAASYDQFAAVVSRAVEALKQNKALEGGKFTPGDLRRTIETRLAAAGQTDEARGQLQSHGLGGVQNRHYNLHRYDDEKRAALMVLHGLLTSSSATVTPIKGRRAAARRAAAG